MGWRSGDAYSLSYHSDASRGVSAGDPASTGFTEGLAFLAVS